VNGYRCRFAISTEVLRGKREQGVGSREQGVGSTPAALMISLYPDTILDKDAAVPGALHLNTNLSLFFIKEQHKT
jgi:hypothetical protein